MSIPRYLFYFLMANKLGLAKESLKNKNKGTFNKMKP